MKNLIIHLILAISFFSLFANAGQAQQATATLTGVVTDPNGAVISGATVTATNKATNLTRTTSTNDEGVYVISSLPVGNYEIKVSFQGFQERIFNFIELNVGQTLTVNTDLIVGVEVDAGMINPEVPLVDSQTSKVDAVINDKEIENLPLNGRNFLELALLTPGNAPAPNFDPTKTNTVVVSSAGQLGRGGNVMIDGADNNDDVVGGSLVNISQDAVQEFQIATNRFSAEYGRSASS